MKEKQHRKIVNPFYMSNRYIFNTLQIKKITPNGNNIHIYDEYIIPTNIYFTKNMSFQKNYNN